MYQILYNLLMESTREQRTEILVALYNGGKPKDFFYFLQKF